MLNDIILNFNPTPGEPREHHLVEVRPKSLSCTNFHKRQNGQQGRHSLAHFEKISKEVTGLKKKHNFESFQLNLQNFSGPVT